MGDVREARLSRVWPWLAAAAFFAVAIPLAFAVGYLVFGGGWRDLPEPWRTRALVFVALLVAVVVVARWLRGTSGHQPVENWRTSASGPARDED